MAQPLPTPTPLPSPPTDGITSLTYLRPPSSAKDLLACTSWDGTLRIYDARSRTHLVKKSFDVPLLSLAGGIDGGAVYCGGIDGSVFQFDIEGDVVTTMGSHHHDDPMRRAASCLNVVDEHTLASAGWDGTFRLWDVRCNNNGDGSSSNNDNNNSDGSSSAVSSLELPGKAFSMDVSHQTHTAAVATSSRRNAFLDLRRTSDPVIVLDRESSLKYQTRCVRFLPGGRGIAAGSVEGRVAVEYLDELKLSSGDTSSSSQKNKKYAFKCHRISDTIYPVNDIAFHPVHGTFATGGADGSIVTWDGNSKKKLATVAKLPTSVACLAFNEDGTQMALASSYTFEEGERDHPREEIYVRDVLEGEVMPKNNVGNK